MKILPYIGIIVLLLIVLLQNRSCSPADITPPNIDTVIVYETIRDTVEVEVPTLVAAIPDTVWLKEEENAPDSTYDGLLYQYAELGNRHFTTNVFKSEFQIEDYGKITVTDSIYGNWLMSSTLVTDLEIVYPEITITKTAPSRNQMYIGTTFTGNKSYPISGVYGGLMLKTKQDRLYGAAIGWTGEITYSFSLYYKIKLRK
jgi:hypothetical protein